MKVPFSWLKEYVDIDISAQELETKLFSCGFEVEELIPLSAGIHKVVVGVVTAMELQEGTHLHKCVVDCGEYGHEVRISTGASNVFVGAHVPTALDGSDAARRHHHQKAGDAGCGVQWNALLRRRTGSER